MANKNKKRSVSQRTKALKEEVVENESIQVELTVSGEKLAELVEEQEITPEDLVAQEEFIFEDPSVEEAPKEECVCEQPCVEPCVCDELPTPEELTEGLDKTCVCIDTPEVRAEVENFIAETQAKIEIVEIPQAPVVRTKTVDELNSAEYRNYRRTGYLPNFEV